MERRQQQKDRENSAPILPSAYICRIWKRTVTPELVCTVTAGAVPPTTDSPGAEPIVFRDKEAYVFAPPNHICVTLVLNIVELLIFIQQKLCLNQGSSFVKTRTVLYSSYTGLLLMLLYVVSYMCCSSVILKKIVT